jgi:hypothetical protein
MTVDWAPEPIQQFLKICRYAERLILSTSTRSQRMTDAHSEPHAAAVRPHFGKRAPAAEPTAWRRQHFRTTVLAAAAFIGLWLILLHDTFAANRAIFHHMEPASSGNVVAVRMEDVLFSKRRHTRAVVVVQSSPGQLFAFGCGRKAQHAVGDTVQLITDGSGQIASTEACRAQLSVWSLLAPLLLMMLYLTILGIAPFVIWARKKRRAT